MDAEFSTTGAGGKQVPINLIPYLMAHQESKVRDPDVILQLAHHLSEQLAAAGEPAPIFADMTVKLNGRPAAEYIIDPTTDLTSKSRTIRHADWIYGSPEDSK